MVASYVLLGSSILGFSLDQRLLTAIKLLNLKDGPADYASISLP